MSLINDALKKAQRQRGDDAPADTPPAGGPVRARREQPSSGQPLIVRVGIGVIALCAVVVTVVVLTRREPTAASPTAAAPVPVAAAPAVPSISPAVATPQATPTPAAPAPAVASPASTTTPTPASAPVVASTPTASTPAPAEPASATPISVPTLALEPAPTPATPVAALQLAEQDKRILTYLDNLRVTAIRPAGEDTKVLMNDRVYRLNDVVDRSLGLRLTGVAVRRLDFTDERGVAYVKTF